MDLHYDYGTLTIQPICWYAETLFAQNLDFYMYLMATCMYTYEAFINFILLVCLFVFYLFFYILKHRVIHNAFKSRQRLHICTCIS